MRQFKEKAQFKLILTALSVIFVMSLFMILACGWFYQRYEDSLIDTEKSQLQTIAGIIGNNLSSSISRELEETELCFGDEAVANQMNKALLERKCIFFLQQNPTLYSRIVLALPDGSMECFSVDGETVSCDAAGENDVKRLESAEAAEETRISGKELAEDGWYEMYVTREIQAEDGAFRIMLALRLQTIYEEIVAPVKIGQNGYSVVKDENLDIIMHHAEDQIGMEAVTGRSNRYPELNLSSLAYLTERQKNEEQGTDILNSYVWDDPELPSVTRLVAFTAIYIQNERWIVNSTLPLTELSEPLTKMMCTLVMLGFGYICLVVLITLFFMRSRFRTVSQGKEIQYLKEINHGMELLAEKNNELRHLQRVQSLGMMASHIAHEFNNYLTPVLIYTDLLENDPEISEENREMVKEMAHSVDRAAALSKELLAFSRQDTGVRLQRLNFTEEVQTALTVIGQLAPAKITVETRVTEENLYIMGRQGMAEHILMNLCKNAFQAMEQSAEKRLEISFQRDAADVLLRVRDTGCGIGAEAQKQIFEPFYTTKGSRQGTGLGLSVVQNILRSVGGSIEVDSRPEEGTCFSVRIPEETGERKRLQHVSRIAVISPDPILRKWKRTLEKGNYRVDAYEHPAAILSSVQKDASLYQMLIVEQQLGAMSGIDLCEVVRRANPEIRLVLTAEKTETEYEWYLNNGMIDRFVTKSELQRELEKMLGDISLT